MKLTVMMMKLISFSGIMYICVLVNSLAALAPYARAASDITRAQINIIPEYSQLIRLLTTVNPGVRRAVPRDHIVGLGLELIEDSVFTF